MRSDNLQEEAKNNKLKMMPDSPKEGSEDDKFGRSDLAQNLVNIINALDTEHSFAISVEGKWGEGKTSFVNFLTTLLEKEKAHKVIRFKPFYYSDRHDLFGNFAELMNARLSSKDKFCSLFKGFFINLFFIFTILALIKWHNEIKNYCALLCFSSVLSVLLTAFNLLSSTLNKRLLQLIYLLYNGIPIFPTKQSSDIEEDLKKIKLGLKDRLDKDKKAIVIIDDIDRLRPEEMLRVFELVKSWGDMPHIVFILAYDPAIVIDALKSKHRYINTDEYLEKFIQHRCILPPINPDTLYKIIVQDITEAIGRELTEIEAKSDLTLIKQYFRNYREVIRFINILKAKHQLIKDEVDDTDLILLTAIESKENAVYLKLRVSESIVCDDSPTKQEKDERKKEVLNEFRQFLNAQAKETQDIIKELFPKLKDWPELASEDLKVGNIIASTRNFWIHFSLKVPSWQISNKDFEKLKNSNQESLNSALYKMLVEAKPYKIEESYPEKFRDLAHHFSRQKAADDAVRLKFLTAMNYVKKEIREKVPDTPEKKHYKEGLYSCVDFVVRPIIKPWSTDKIPLNMDDSVDELLFTLYEAGLQGAMAKWDETKTTIKELLITELQIYHEKRNLTTHLYYNRIKNDKELLDGWLSA